MTKEQEITQLDRMITHFPQESSYLGPWLREYRSAIVADIHNDVMASAPMPSVAVAEARTILEAAKTERAEIIAKAHRDAQTIRDDARDDASRTRQYAKQTISHALAQL